MGVFELHLHEPNFTLNVGEDGPKLDAGRTDTGRTKTDGDEGPPSITGKLGPVFVLLAVIALALVRNRRRE